MSINFLKSARISWIHAALAAPPAPPSGALRAPRRGGPAPIREVRADLRSGSCRFSFSFLFFFSFLIFFFFFCFFDLPPRLVRPAAARATTASPGRARPRAAARAWPRWGKRGIRDTMPRVRGLLAVFGPPKPRRPSRRRGARSAARRGAPARPAGRRGVEVSQLARRSSVARCGETSAAGDRGVAELVAAPLHVGCDDV
ncbi:unnamed protein product [Prorocentrum cordatum]|uniref:Uncharacterized protein n=1 Tax=Prorocentrum cordatum TaxID=2364126 RepID=A0ABN9RNH8_9DINO|nr:unnamed protein product [Polarella glacialis]